MIVVVCLNPALDITYQVPAVTWDGVNRPSAVYARPGGKGLNVDGATGRDAVASEVTRLLDLLGAGSAAAVGTNAMVGGAGESLSPVE